MSEVALEHVKHLAARLSRSEKERLAAWLESTSCDEPVTPTASSRRSLYGLCADLGPGPTDEDIDMVRREMWANFPRADIA